MAAQDVGELAQSSHRAVFNLRLSCELFFNAISKIQDTKRA